jgi:CheY-like chemotaxis protein
MKPVLPNELLVCLTMIAGRAGTAAASVSDLKLPHRLNPPAGKLRILLAENNIVNQLLAVRLLEKRGHLVKTVNNGREVLTALRQAAYDLVLLDVQMPEMDGFKVTAAVRQIEDQVRRGLIEVQANSSFSVLDESRRGIPIIAMAANLTKTDEERILESGMNGGIAKPLQAQELFTNIEQWGISPKLMEGRETAPGMNWQAALRDMDGDEKLLREVMAVFLKEVPQLRQNLHQAVECRDAAQLHTTVYALKGAVSNFHDEEVNQAMALLETSERCLDWNSLTHALSQLKSALDQLVIRLSRLEEKGSL